MEITRTFDLLDNMATTYGHKTDTLAARVDGKWVKYSSKEYHDLAYKASVALLEMGLKKGDRIVTISNNRPEWNVMDMGMSQIGVVQVPIYPTISAEEYDYILNHAEPKLVMLSDQALYEKISPLAKKVKSISKVNKITKILN